MDFAILTALALLGLIVLAGVNADIVWTTLSHRGSGPIGQGAMALAYQMCRRAPVLRAFAGPVAHVAGAGVWVLLLWFGWTLLFLGLRGQVTSQQIPDFWNTFYFAGASLSTLGLAAEHPVGPVWQVATALAAVNGLIVITLAVAYVLSVSSSVIETRRMAASTITLAGPSASALARLSAKDDHRMLMREIWTAREAILKSAQERQSFPMSIYFTAPTPQTSHAVALAVLLDAVLLILAMRDTSDQVRRRLEMMIIALEISTEMHKPGVDEPPPLRIPADLPVDHEQAQALAAEHALTRRRIMSLILNEGWDWPA